MKPGDKLAAAVGDALRILSNGKENSVAQLRTRQSEAYQLLWSARESYEKATAKAKE